MQLSKQLSDIALGDYWHEKPLREALASDLLTIDDKETVNLALHGIIDFHALQNVSVKLFNLGV